MPTPSGYSDSDKRALGECAREGYLERTSETGIRAPADSLDAEEGRLMARRPTGREWGEHPREDDRLPEASIDLIQGSHTIGAFGAGSPALMGNSRGWKGRGRERDRGHYEAAAW